MSDRMLEARHELASAAAAIAMVNAHIARALAWETSAERMAAMKSSMNSALSSARAACEDLQSALIRLGIAQEDKQLGS